MVELRAKAATLERKQKLEIEVEKLQLEEQIAIAEAREAMFSKFEEELNLKDGMNNYYEQFSKSKATEATLAQNIPVSTFAPNIPASTLAPNVPASAIASNMPATTHFPNVRARSFHPNLPSTIFHPRITSTIATSNISASGVVFSLHSPKSRSTPVIPKETNREGAMTSLKLPAYSPPSFSYSDSAMSVITLSYPGLRHTSPPLALGVSSTPFDQNISTQTNEQEQATPRSYENRFGLLIEKQCNLTEMIMQQNQQTLLPRLELTKFAGDPTDYNIFIQGFNSQFHAKLTSNSDRLRYLEQYLEGEAKEVIKGCHYMHPDAGYVEERKLIEDKYGNPYNISNAFIKKITEWPML